MMGKDWKDLREDAERLAYLYGFANFARKIPASRSSVYNWFNGSVETPNRAAQASIERMVADRESSSNLGQSSDSDD